MLPVVSGYPNAIESLNVRADKTLINLTNCQIPIQCVSLGKTRLSKLIYSGPTVSATTRNTSAISTKQRYQRTIFLVQDVRLSMIHSVTLLIKAYFKNGERFWLKHPVRCLQRRFEDSFQHFHSHAFLQGMWKTKLLVLSILC